MLKSNSDSKSMKEKELEQEKLILQEMTRVLEEEQSSHMEILSSLSHEFRTPLSVIASYTDLMLAGKYGKITDKQKEKLELIQQNIAILINEIFKILERIPKK